MKSKIGLIAVVFASGLLLSACTNKETIKSGTDDNVTGQEQTQDKTNKPSGAQNRGPGQQMDLAAAAKTLGVTEEALKTALGMDGTETPFGTETTPGAKPSGQPKQMDLAAAAKTLGVTEEALKEALEINNMPSGGPQGGERQEGSESAPVSQE